MADRRHRLAQRRRTVGLSQERLAEMIGVDRSTVVRWERANTDPQPWHRPRLADALRVTVEQLAELLAHAGDAGVRPPTLAHPSFQSIPCDLTGVGVDDLDTMLSFRRADCQVGGGHLYATVTGYLQQNIAPRLFGHSPDSEEQPVFRAAAGLTEMVGWMAHDAGHDAIAEQHFQRALAMSQIGEDSQLGAHIYGSLSHLAHHRKLPDRALLYAAQGHQRLRTGPSHPGLKARLHAMQARSHAADGDRDRCADELHRAECALAGPPAASSSPWASTFDEASLAAEAARCFRRLGRLGAARRAAARVVALRPPERARSRAFAHLMLISILVDEDQPEEACTIARDVLVATRGLGSMLVVQQLEVLDQRLVPHQGSAEVAEFLAMLHAELHQRHQLRQWGGPGAAGAP